MNILLYTLLAAFGFIVFLQVTAWLGTRKMLGKRAPVAVGSGRHLYYFFSPRCGACKSVTPIIDRLSKHAGNVHKVDVSADPDQAIAFGVRATPTLMLVENGHIARVTLGGTSEHKLEQMLLG